MRFPGAPPPRQVSGWITSGSYNQVLNLNIEINGAHDITTWLQNVGHMNRNRTLPSVAQGNFILVKDFDT
ncbi:MAG: hypothetical protein ACREE4_10040 [Stellaceae bacterium]